MVSVSMSDPTFSPLSANFVYQPRRRDHRCLVKVTCSHGEADELDELHTRYNFLRRNNYWSRADGPTERVVWKKNPNKLKSCL
jgi:hypothetical protein